MQKNSGENSAPGILIVDDDPQIIKLLRRFLESKGHAVQSAENGRRALELVDLISPRLILLDIAMPEMSGPETLRELRARGRQTPVLMISGAQDEAVALECMKLGAYDFITKPLDMDYLDLSVWAKIQLANPE